ncbi:MAG: hypothetical protein K2K29_07200 [Muribaculaceae bacterium]|nr:hypothetical protein [Muribaculaceae bacterium]
MVKVLNEIKDMKGPRILHLHTVKGKGFPKAEEDPTTWHAPGKFNPDNGERHPKPEDAPPLWQEVFGHTLVDLAGENDKIVGITAAMPSGTSMGLMLKAYPERTFDVGISEGHAVTFAGGLAAAGKHPIVAIYSSFLQRAYDNIIHDVAIQGLPVTFCIDRAGLVGEDGVTHHGLFDMVYLRCIPGMAIASPMDAPALQSLMLTAVNHNGPMAIRYPRGKTPAAPPAATDISNVTPQPIGKGRILTQTPGARIAVLTIGEIGNEAAKALKEIDFPVDHYDMIWLKPLDEELLQEINRRYDVIITVEDGVREGGFGTAVAQFMDHPRVIQLGVPDRWITQGSVAELRKLCGMDSASIKVELAKAYQEISKD